MSEKKRFPREVRREQILSEACRLFALGGYDGTSIADIANAVDVTPSLISNYFSGKDEIFEVLFERFVEMINRPQQITIVNRSAIDTLRQFALNHISMNIGQSQEEEYLAEAIASRRSFDEKRFEALRDATDIISDYIHPVVAYGQSNGEIRAGDAKTLASVFFAYVAGCRFLLTNLSNRFTMPDIEYALDIVRIEPIMLSKE